MKLPLYTLSGGVGKDCIHSCLYINGLLPISHVLKYFFGKYAIFNHMVTFGIKYKSWRETVEEKLCKPSLGKSKMIAWKHSQKCNQSKTPFRTILLHFLDLSCSHGTETEEWHTFANNTGIEYRHCSSYWKRSYDNTEPGKEKLPACWCSINKIHPLNN